MGTRHPSFLGPKEPIQPNPKQESSAIPSPITEPDTDIGRNLHFKLLPHTSPLLQKHTFFLLAK